jgi:carbohydrate diacid regulator
VVVRLHGRRRGEAGLVAVDESETVVITDEAGADRLEGPGGSASATGIEGLPDAFARAGRAWRLGEATAGGGGVHRYTDVETYDTLVGHLEGKRLERLRARVTDPLPPPLLDTLRAYLGSAGSIAETARATYVHRNTVHYRVRRIEQLTGLDLSRLEDRLLCELALFAERVGR